MKKLSLFAILFLVVGSAMTGSVAGECSASKADAAETAAVATASEHECAGDCACTKSTDLAMLALKAEQGCASSTAQMIELAKQSGHEDLLALATKAEGGCDHSKAALIAKMKEGHAPAVHAVASSEMVELAKHAEGGCSASSGKLIAAAKQSDDKNVAELASRAEGGCEHSKAALIAMVIDAEKKDEK